MSEEKKTATLRMIIQMTFLLLLSAFLPIVVSGRWAWWEGWVYAALQSVGFLLSRLLAAQRHPDLLEERMRSMQLKDAKSFDKILVPLLALGGIAFLFVIGLDQRQQATPPFSLPVKLAALGVLLFGYAFSSWALIENRFFSGVVRIQNDRGHRVVSTGPYRYVRHPGYAGALAMYLATPLFLEALWSYLPAACLCGILGLRTFLEDRTLQAELPGYAEYAQTTRYRLFPGLW